MSAPDPQPIRDAATVIVLRGAERDPRILMGQRGRNAAFMPSKFVFPGGAVDPADAAVPLARALSPGCASRLQVGSDRAPEAFIAAATRELWEETGLILGQPGPAPAPETAPAGWASYFGHRHLPDGAAFEFIFRAITPPGRPRRFDARFFLARAEAITGDLDDFSQAEDELQHIQWVPLAQARAFDLPFITEVVLAELAAKLSGRARTGVPFFDNSSDVSRFRRL